MSKEEKLRVFAVLWSALVAFLILFFAQTTWGLLLAANFRNSPRAVPWSVVAMAVVLWLLWQYLGGRWWPPSTAVARKQDLRANRVSRRAFTDALLAGLLSMIALAGLWI